MIINNLPVESGSSGAGMVCKEESELASEYILSNGYEKETLIAKVTSNTTKIIRYELLEDYLITLNPTSTSDHIKAQKILDDGSISSEYSYLSFPYNPDASYPMRCCVIENNLYIFYFKNSPADTSVLLKLNCDDNGVLSLTELYSGASDYDPYCNNMNYTYMFGHGNKIWIHSYGYLDGNVSNSGTSLGLNEFDLELNMWIKLGSLGFTTSGGYQESINYLRNSEYFKGYFYRIEKSLILYRYKSVENSSSKEELLTLPFYRGDKTLSTESKETYDYKLIPYEDIMHIIISRRCTDDSWISNHYIFDGENVYIADNDLKYIPNYFLNSPTKYYKGKPVYQKNDGIYYLIDTKDTKKYRIVLPKNKKIYLDTSYGMNYIIPFTNCKIEDDHLVVLEDGVVEFGVQLYDSLKRISCF